jgi:A/G-specific adenine glycosylase
VAQHERKIRFIVSRLLEWYGKNARDLPWRREPHCRNPYCVHVSEIMLQQTQVKTVIPYWVRWMRALPDLRALAGARLSTVHKLWEGLGYYTRARNLHKAAKMIVRERGGRFPERFEEVLALPGVGRYTAGAVCSIAFNQPTPIVDGNVTRVLTRLFGISGSPRERPVNRELWALAQELVSAASRTRKPGACSALNQALMELGSVVCTPRAPRCAGCPVARQCAALREGRVQEIPARTVRRAAESRRVAAFILERNGRLLVRQRPDGVVNAQLWEFPSAEQTPGTDLAAAAREALGFVPRKLSPFCTLKHTITHHRITLEVFLAAGGLKGRKPRAGRWVALPALRKLSFPSAHREIATRLQRTTTRR